MDCALQRRAKAEAKAGLRGVVVDTPSGGKAHLYIEADKNLTIIRREVRTKRVKDMLARMHPGTELFPSRLDGVTSSSYRPIVKVEVHPDETALKFNEAVLATLDMCKGDILRNWTSETEAMSQIA